MDCSCFQIAVRETPSVRAKTSPEITWPGFPSKLARSLSRVDTKNIETAVKGGNGMREASHRDAVGTQLGQTREDFRV